MLNKSRWLAIGFICIGTVAFTLILLGQLKIASAQTTEPEPFLYPPYFGTHSVTAVFDHEHPRYDAEANFGDTPAEIHQITSTVMHNDGVRYTETIEYSGHDGIDYNLNHEYVLAAASGEVEAADWHVPGNRRIFLGLRVEVDHGDYDTVYGHLSAIFVQVGEVITRTSLTDTENSLIGLSGDTGTSSGPHLHLSVKVSDDEDDIDVNPYSWNSNAVNDPWENEFNEESFDLWEEYPSISNGTVYTDGPEVVLSETLAARLNPVITAPTTLVIDDDDVTFVTSGTWTLSNCTPATDTCYDNAMHYSQITGTTATWQPAANALETADYDVYVHIPTKHATTRLADYEIVHNGLTNYGGINQREYLTDTARPWAYLGRHNFAGNGNEYVRLTSNRISGEDVAADAVAFVLVDESVMTTTTTITLPIAIGTDDAGDFASSADPCGATNPVYSTTHNEVYFGDCPDGTAVVSGLRFQNATIPQGANIQNAHINFTVDGTYTRPITVTFHGELTHDSATFSVDDTPRDRLVTSTNATVSWTVQTTWNVEDEFESPSLTAIVQEIVDLNAWESGDPITLMITSTGSNGNHRRVFAVERPMTAATAELIVTYGSAGPAAFDPDHPFLEINEQVVIEAEHFARVTTGTAGHTWQDESITGYLGESAMQTLPNSGTNTNLNTTGPTLQFDVNFENSGDYYIYIRGYSENGSNDDDSVLVGIDNVLVTASGSGMASFDDPFRWLGKHNGIDTLIDIPTEGTYTIYIWMREDGVAVDRLWMTTERQGGLHYSSSRDGPAESPQSPTGLLERRVRTGNDDAEQNATSGAMIRGSSDLELIRDGSTTDQIVGVRFQNVMVPPDASITNAYIVFETDETTTETTDLTIWGEAADDANGFASSSFDITSRMTTTVSVDWSPGAWSTVNETHQTPDLQELVEDIVGRAGWEYGNAMVFIIDGSGQRIAESYNGETAAAAFLYVEYTVP